MIYVNIKRQRYLKDFLTLLYSHLNGGYLMCVESFKDELYTVSQCKAGKYRSIDELLEIVNTYYPSITFERLSKVIHSLIIEKDDKKFKFYSLYCGKVQRTTTLFTIFNCEFNTTKKGDSKYSSKEFYKLSK